MPSIKSGGPKVKFATGIGGNTCAWTSICPVWYAVQRPKRAKKAVLAKKNATGRQLARVSATYERETVWSDLFPGNRHTIQCLQPAVLGAENALELSEKQRQRTVWRLDGGSGSDEQFRWLLARGYHLVGKGLSGRRANALAKQVKRWDGYGPDAWIGEVPPPVDLGRPVRFFVKKRLKQGEIVHSYYVSTLSLSSKSSYLAHYDNRGAAEVEQFRNDKSGLSLEARRKRSFTGQKAYILLTDLAHNLLANFYHRALVDSPFADYGPKRIVRDLFSFPGRLVFEQENLVRVELLSQKHFSEDLANCLNRFILDSKSE